jgi:hypothetical protein
MKKKSNKCFKSVEEYKEFYSSPSPETKHNKNKYYLMGMRAAQLASEETLKTTLKPLQ